MRRPSVLVSVAVSVVGMPLARAQQPERPPGVAFLYFGSERAAAATGRYPAFLDGMRAPGYVDGKNYSLEARLADSQAARMSYGRDLAENIPPTLLVRADEVIE